MFDTGGLASFFDQIEGPFVVFEHGCGSGDGETKVGEVVAKGD